MGLKRKEVRKTFSKFCSTLPATCICYDGKCLKKNKNINEDFISIKKS